METFTVVVVIIVVAVVPVIASMGGKLAQPNRTALSIRAGIRPVE